MPNFKSAVIGRVYISRWTGLGTTADLRDQLEEMTRAAARLKQKLYYISIVPEGTPPLSSDVRSELVRSVPEVLEHCDSVYNVLEGVGFWAGTMRSMLSGMVLASRITRGKVHVCSTLDEALGKIGDGVGIDRDSFLRRAKLDGVTV